MECAGRRRTNGAHRNSVNRKSEKWPVACEYIAIPSGIANMLCRKGVSVEVHVVPECLRAIVLRGFVQEKIGLRKARHHRTGIKKGNP